MSEPEYDCEDMEKVKIYDSLRAEIDSLRAKLTELAAKNFQHQAENERLMTRLKVSIGLSNIERETIERIQCDNDRLRAEVAELKEDLLGYGVHHHSCRKRMYPLLEPEKCDCGWSAVIARHFPPPDPSKETEECAKAT